MGRRLPFLPAAAVALGLAAAPAPLAAQAFTPPKGLGSLTLAWQYVDNTGHRLSDGFYVTGGESVTTSLLLDAEYAVTDRLSASLGVPYVLAKYTGKNEPFSGLAIDACRCWQSSLQDVALAVRYRLGSDAWAVTPAVRVSLPTHDYGFAGEAVVGKNLKEAQIGALVGARLSSLPAATVQAGYMYSLVESPLDDISVNRSNGFLDLGYSVNRRLYARGMAVWQRTHGGLRAGSPTGVPFLFPGELDRPERWAQRDRALRTHYWQLGGGLTYSSGPLDVFVSYSRYVWGRDSHNGHVFGAGATWYFGLPD